MSTLKDFKFERCKRLSEEIKIEGLILSLPENILYFSGFFPEGMTILHSTETYLVMNPSNGRMGLVTSASDVPTILEGNFKGNIYAVGAFKFTIFGKDQFSLELTQALSKRYSSYTDGILAAVEDLLGGMEQIAIDEARMPVSTYKQLAERIPNCQCQSASPLMYSIRSIKHAEEVELLRVAANIAEDSLMEAIKRIKPGVSETDIFHDYRMQVTQRGASPYFCVVTANERAAFSDTLAQSTSLVKDGGMIRFDFGCIFQGYRSDLARTVLIGENEKVRKYYQAILEGEEKAIEAVRPGVTAGEIFDIAVKTTQKAGIAHYSRHHVGHGIGIATYDFPSLTSGNSTQLEEGMVLCVETPYYEIGWGGVQVEDTVVVTSNGAEYLSKSSRELICI